MKCLRCGMEVADNSKFCGYCGNPLVQPNQVQEPVQPLENVVNPEPSVNTLPSVEPVSNYESVNLSQNLNNLNNVESLRQELNQNVMPSMQQIEQPVPNQEQPKTSKKKVNPLIYIGCIVGVVLLAVIILLMTVFNKNSNNTSISVLEKAIANLQSKSSVENLSGTVVATINIETENNESLNFEGTVKYQKLNDELKLQLTVGKSMFFDEINLYAKSDDKTLALYLNTDLVDMISGTESVNNSWVYYEADLSELSLDLDELNSNETIDLSDLEKNFKYVGKDGNLNHYTLTLDNDLVESLMDNDSLGEYQEFMEDSDATLVIDFYIDNNDELKKISMNLSTYLKDYGVKKALITIELKDFNGTIVTIPEDALSGQNIETYLEENFSEYNVDYDEVELDF